MRRALWLAGVPLATLAGGAAGFFPVFVMSLVVPVLIVGPLSLLSAAWLATVSAGWTANFAAWGQSRSRLPMTFACSLIGAILALPAYWAAAWMINTLYSPPNVASLGAIYYSPHLAGGVVFAAITSAATWKLRLQAQGGLAGDLRLTLLSLVTVPALIVGTIFVGCNLTYCGA